MLSEPPAQRMRLGQLLSRWVAIPLSALPFLAYATFTPEGRLVRDRVVVAVAPPSLPKLSPRQKADAQAVAPRYEGAVMTLAYHGIGSATDGEGGFVVSPQRFGEHLASLRAGGMNVVTARDVDGAFRGGPALPPNAVMITFDDGRSDAMLFADPLLEQARMKATMFVISDAASRSGVYYAPWKRLKGYARSGRWDIQAHTSGSHHEQKVAGGGQLPALTSLGRGESLDEYRERVREDLAEASDAIEANLGYRPVALAYPFGAYGADRTNHPAIRDVLRQEVSRQYALAFHQDDQEQIPLVTADADRLGLRRLEVEGWSGTLLLQHIADAARRSGFAPPGPPPESGGDDHAAPTGLPELALAGPAPVVSTEAQSQAAPSVPGGDPGGATPGGVASGGTQVTDGAQDAIGGVTALAPSLLPSLLPSLSPFPLPTLGPASGPTPTTAVRPPTVTTPPPSTTSPPTTRPPSTTPTTSPPTTRPTTTPSCPSTGKPKPGCPPRGGTP